MCSRKTAEPGMPGEQGACSTETPQTAPRRSRFEKVRANYTRKVMVEGKGFVDCALNPDGNLARTKWQTVSFRGLPFPFRALGRERFGWVAPLRSGFPD